MLFIKANEPTAIGHESHEKTKAIYHLSYPPVLSQYLCITSSQVFFNEKIKIWPIVTWLVDSQTCAIT